jgi:hypothetical protein
MLKRITAAAVVLSLLLALAVFTVHAESDVTVYYYNSDGWDEVCVYTWEPNEQFGSWPGGACTDDGDGWWSIVMPDFTAGNHIIFNNNDNGQQNSDLVLEDGQVYFYGSRDTEEGMASSSAEVISALGGVVDEPAEEEPAEEAAPANPKTGESPLLPISMFVMVMAGGSAVILNSRRKKAANN